MNSVYRQARRLIHSEAKQTPYYKTFVKRNFTRHSNYLDFKIIMADLAAYLLTAETGVPMKAKEGHDPAYMGMLHSAYMAWKNPLFPVYAILPDLANALMHTDIPTHVCKMQKMFDIALFLLPSGLIKNPDRLSCDWLLVTHFHSGDYHKYTQGYQDFLRKILHINPAYANVDISVTEGLDAGENKLRWATNLSGIYSYANIMALPKDSNSPTTGAFIHRGLANDVFELEAERDFTNIVNSLILQTMLYMQLPKIEQNVVVDKGTKSKHFRQGFDPHSPQEPIWLGMKERERTIKKQPLGGNHASPVTHWRRGHWRMLGSNSESNPSRLVWVKPTIING